MCQVYLQADTLARVGDTSGDLLTPPMAKAARVLSWEPYFSHLLLQPRGIGMPSVGAPTPVPAMPEVSASRMPASAVTMAGHPPVRLAVGMSSFLGSATLIGATVATGLTSGLFYVFAHSVMPGLGRLPDTEYLRAFQYIDAAIANPWMGLAYLGAPVLGVGALALHLRDGDPAAGWIGVGVALTLAAVAMTAAVNLPLNAQIQAAAPDFVDSAALRRRFERPWVAWNLARTVTSVASLVLLSVALTQSGRAA